MLPASSIKTVSFTNSFSIVFFARSVKIKDSFLALVLMYVCWGNFDCNTDSLAYLAGYNLQSNIDILKQGLEGLYHRTYYIGPLNRDSTVQWKA